MLSQWQDTGYSRIYSRFICLLWDVSMRRGGAGKCLLFFLLTKRWTGQLLLSLDVLSRKMVPFQGKMSTLFWRGSQLPVVLESTDWSVPWVELSRSCRVSGEGGGSAARTG